LENWIQNPQFGFRQAHSKIQCHRVANTIIKALEIHQFCTAAFLNVSHAFDKVWHPGLLFKIKKKSTQKISQPTEIIFTGASLRN
jgi:hypothetical protein